ncbi:MAG: hypothetical protein OXU62_04580 [Gammaproteobacteria bacterium]|nr:hypothetical protein [Gammaproteobacteria bacterium]
MKTQTVIIAIVAALFAATPAHAQQTLTLSPTQPLIYYIVFMCLLAVVMNVNMYMRGISTNKNDFILYGVLALSHIVCIFLFDWRYALASLVLFVLFSKIILPPCRYIAGKILGYKVGYQETTGLHGKASPEYFHFLEQKLYKKLSGNTMQSILDENGFTVEDVFDEIGSLTLNGFDHGLACEMFGSPKQIQVYFEWKKNHSPHNIASVIKLRQMLL